MFTMLTNYVGALSRILFHPFYILYITCLQLKVFIKNKHYFLYPIFIYFYYLKNYRKIKKLINNNSELTYGEITYHALNKCLKHVIINQNTLFIDMGAGYGKTIFHINNSLNIPCIGLEINNYYVEIFNKYFKNQKNELFKLLEIDCKNYHFTIIPKEKELIVYIPGTCFSMKTIKILEENISKSNHKVIIITLSEPLNINTYPIKYRFKSYFDWGLGTIYIQEKKSFNLA